VALLPAIAFHFADGHAVDMEPLQVFPHVVELEWFYDGDDEFHGSGQVRNSAQGRGFTCAIFVQGAQEIVIDEK
jgi:hypothetical protein